MSCQNANSFSLTRAFGKPVISLFATGIYCYPTKLSDVYSQNPGVLCDLETLCSVSVAEIRNTNSISILTDVVVNLQTSPEDGPILYNDMHCEVVTKIFY